MLFLSFRVNAEVPSHELKQPLTDIYVSRYQYNACCTSEHKHHEHLHVDPGTFGLFGISNRPYAFNLFKDISIMDGAHLQIKHRSCKINHKQYI